MPKERIRCHTVAKVENSATKGFTQFFRLERPSIASWRERGIERGARAVVVVAPERSEDATSEIQCAG
jgi:hypothetical protein